jgi:hypothetical protein
MTGEWIEHDGERTPDLAPGTMVLVKFRDGYSTTVPVPFEEWDWTHDDQDEDIIMYAVVPRK